MILLKAAAILVEE